MATALVARDPRTGSGQQGMWQGRLAPGAAPAACVRLFPCQSRALLASEGVRSAKKHRSLRTGNPRSVQSDGAGRGEAPACSAGSGLHFGRRPTPVSNPERQASDKRGLPCFPLAGKPPRPTPAESRPARCPVSQKVLRRQDVFAGHPDGC